MRTANPPAFWFHRPLKPPSGRALFDLIADAEPFHRESLIKQLVPDAAGAAREVARGEVELTRGESVAPRLIIAGDSDPFAPIDRTAAFAESIGAELRRMPRRGHWIIGGRALERVVGEAHRFLVRTLGQELLLLYPEEWKEEP